MENKVIECSGAAIEKTDFTARPRYNRINLILVKNVFCSKPKGLIKVRA